MKKRKHYIKFYFTEVINMCKPKSTETKNVVECEERTESATGGVEAMSIEGRMASERERCIGMTPEERAWRAQWLKDQILEPDEPTLPEGYYEARYNPIRRFYRAPMEKFERALGPKLVNQYSILHKNILAFQIKSFLEFFTFCEILSFIKQYLNIQVLLKDKFFLGT